MYEFNISYVTYRGAMCGGGGGADLWSPTVKVSAVEREVLNRELSLGLACCQFQFFEFALKRYGYTGRLTD